jgi:hypothetical protein
MTDKAISPLRRRLIEDMTIRRLSANTQHQYITVKRGQRRHRKSSRRQRVERLSLLRRAYDHHRDFRTWLRASALAHPIARARQLMTTTLLPPPRITEPGPGWYPAGNGQAAPIATVSAHSDRHNADRSARHRRPDRAHSDQSQTPRYRRSRRPCSQSPDQIKYRRQILWLTKIVSGLAQMPRWAILAWDA